MLYLIGGPPRVGKSLLGQRLAGERRGRWVATDFLRETFADVVPEFRSFEWHEAASMAAHADRFCVYFMERFAAMASSPADEYVTEGLELIPPVMAKLREAFPVRPLLLGNSAPDLETIRRHGGVWGAWVEDLPAAQREALPSQIAARSLVMRAECEALGIPFVDTAGRFEAAMDEAAGLLVRD